MKLSFKPSQHMIHHSDKQGRKNCTFDAYKINCSSPLNHLAKGLNQHKKHTQVKGPRSLLNNTHNSMKSPTEPSNRRIHPTRNNNQNSSLLVLKRTLTINWTRPSNLLTEGFNQHESEKSSSSSFKTTLTSYSSYPSITPKDPSLAKTKVNPLHSQGSKEHRQLTAVVFQTNLLNVSSQRKIQIKKCYLKN